jgi:hypothetical protein
MPCPVSQSAPERVHDLTYQTVTTGVATMQELAAGRTGTIVASVVLAAAVGSLWIAFR